MRVEDRLKEYIRAYLEEDCLKSPCENYCRFSNRCWGRQRGMRTLRLCTKWLEEDEFYDFEYYKHDLEFTLWSYMVIKIRQRLFLEGIWDLGVELATQGGKNGR